jgi:hypothetical protein
MPRVAGDKNYSDREKRLKAENKALKAKVEALKAASKVKDARLKELRNRP